MSNPQKKTKDISTGRIKSIIDILTKNNINRITISGGEPFTRRDITEILSYSSKKAETGAVSNGTLIDMHTAEKLSGINLTRIMISLDGNESAHDALRGKGAHKKAKEGISNCKKCGVPVGISTTLNSLNHESIMEVYDYLKRNNINRWIIETLKPQGRAKEKNLSLEKKQQDSAIIALNKLIAKEESIKISIYNCEKNCTAGKTAISVGPNGDVTPCAFIPHAVCGNILKDSWDTIKANIEKYRGTTCFQS